MYGVPKMRLMKKIQWCRCLKKKKKKKTDEKLRTQIWVNSAFHFSPLAEITLRKVRRQYIFPGYQYPQINNKYRLLYSLWNFILFSNYIKKCPYTIFMCIRYYLQKKTIVASHMFTFYCCVDRNLYDWLMIQLIKIENKIISMIKKIIITLWSWQSIDQLNYTASLVSNY